MLYIDAVEKLRGIIGSPLHLRLAGTIDFAKKYSFEYWDTKLIKHIALNEFWTVENNLDLLSWYQRTLWLEFEESEGESLKKTAVLVVPHPEDEWIYSFHTFVEIPDQGVTHFYAYAFVDIRDLINDAHKSRAKYSKNSSDARQRIIRYVHVTMPKDFEDEIMILHDENREVIDDLMRQATLYIPEALTALLMIENKTCVKTENVGSHIKASLVSTKPTFIDKFLDRFGYKKMRAIKRAVRKRRGYIVLNKTSIT